MLKFRSARTGISRSTKGRWAGTRALDSGGGVGAESKRIRLARQKTAQWRRRQTFSRRSSARRRCRARRPQRRWQTAAQSRVVVSRRSGRSAQGVPPGPRTSRRKSSSADLRGRGLLRRIGRPRQHDDRRIASRQVGENKPAARRHRRRAWPTTAGLTVGGKSSPAMARAQPDSRRDTRTRDGAAKSAGDDPDRRAWTRRSSTFTAYCAGTVGR